MVELKYHPFGVSLGGNCMGYNITIPSGLKKTYKVFKTL
jgi:hypothetical protein